MAHDPTPQPTAEGFDSSSEDESSHTHSSVVSSTTEQSTTESLLDAGDEPETRPVCDVAYDSVSVHDAGLMVNLLNNERYRRVCFEPVTDADGRPLVRFFHHTHGQASLDP